MTTTIDESKVQEFMGQAVADLGATLQSGLVVLGMELGLWKALGEAEAGLTSVELAARTGTNERNIREWLGAQAASGYVTYDVGTERFTLPPEHALVLADDNGPAYLPGACLLTLSALKSIPTQVERFRSGDGIGWHEHDEGLFIGTDMFFRPGYRTSLVDEWLPALDGVAERLETGISVADVGCGFGSSTILMAQAFPGSTFTGFDYHEPSIEAARKAAADAGVADRVRFEVAAAKEFTGTYDLIAYFDCLHDMGDPRGAISHAASRLAPGGSVMIVEPAALDALQDNIHPVGRLFYAASTLICTQASLSQEVGAALGAQAGPAVLADVLRDGGLRDVNIAARTPFNLVLQARP